MAVLIGAVMIGLVWLLDGEPGREPAPMRLVRGDPQTQAIALAFSPEGTTIATIPSEGRVALRSPIAGWSLPRYLGDHGHSRAVAFAPDGRSLALGGTEPGLLVCDLGPEGAERPVKIPIRAASALASSPDGRTLAATSFLSDQILLWDLAARRERTRLCGHSSPVISLAFSPDGRSLASGGQRDQAIIVWDLPTGGQRLRLAAPPGPVMTLTYSPDGSLLASAGVVERSVRIWDPGEGCVVRSIGSHAPSLNSLAFAPDGRLLATADRDGTVKLWRVATGQPLARLDGHADRLGGVAFSPDGRTLAAIGNDDDVRLWDVTEVLGIQTDHPADR
jgi:WD40 repeat protein